ncbi:probable bifunctional TENA-E protein [Impatiens glandulifera]|uniref:probable bifunctional TENA-E protein n=1 Tax=Impatiens glandulifera TaxID=253017 RepID=UPI001FB0B905|nr:probable bifunctional TENA-E protein [Impatiens glandulifera]
MEEEQKKIGIVETWMMKKKHAAVYAAATRHPFIQSIRDGSVDLSAFKRWLGQDYVFVRSFVPFVANLLVKACKESSDDDDMEVILGGLASLNDEISWFKNEALKWNVSLNEVVSYQANVRYCNFLERMIGPEVDFAVAMTVFWVIETVYQESFGYCLEEGSRTPEELKEACGRWGNAGFGEYCRRLREIANRLLEKASANVVLEAEMTLLEVLEHEVQFWNMSQGEPTSLA